MTITTRPTAQNIKGVQWVYDGQRFIVRTNRLYGITDGSGNWLSFDGINPYALDRKRTAAEVAATVDLSGVHWIVDVNHNQEV